jgi:hypothetical protein
MSAEYEVRWVNGQRIAGRMNLLLSLAGRDLGFSLLDRVTQGSYNAGGVGASAGTHDGGGAVDLSVTGLSDSAIWKVLTVLRTRGLIAWDRKAWQGPWPRHIHGIDRGATDRSWSASAQVADFARGLNGLANKGPDDGPKVSVPVMNYEEGLLEWNHGAPGQEHLWATWNCPHRMDPTGDKRRRFIANRIVPLGVSVLLLQEVTDSAATLFPEHFDVHRPKAAQSAAIGWDRRVWRCALKGKYRLHRPIRDRATPRYIPWVVLVNRFSGERVRIGPLHLPAFKDRDEARFRYHARRAGTWLGRPGNRVLGGDWNASPKGDWLDPVLSVGFHSPLAKTGPHQQTIDFFVRKHDRPRFRFVTTIRDSGVSDHACYVVAARV